MMPIAMLSPGESAFVVRFANRAGESGCEQRELGRASDLGLRCGQTVQMLSNSGAGPLLLKVENTRIAIGRDLARRVLVSLEGDRS